MASLAIPSTPLIKRYLIDGPVRIRHGDIAESRINASNMTIKNLGDPEAPTDTANRQYVDARVQQFTIQLLGTTPVSPPLQIVPALPTWGAYQIAVTGTMEEMPCFIFQICRHTSTMTASPQIATFSRNIPVSVGVDGNVDPPVNLCMIWRQGEPFSFWKDSQVLYDGYYTVKIY